MEPDRLHTTEFFTGTQPRSHNKDKNTAIENCEKGYSSERLPWKHDHPDDIPSESVANILNIVTSMAKPDEQGPSVDINDQCRCLIPSERVKILKSHLNNEIDINIESLISTTSTPRFPISCRLFASDQQFRNQGAAFFENPINQLKDEITILSKTNNIAFAGLVLLMLFDGCLNCHLMHSDYYEKSKAISSFLHG
ncbi:Hypothetical predicted protein [Mytilus galloprovincialis]|uniref:Uncharacterized protein n=1 Tax=Mytilus galloprovincialis TaxID=29158 RepID=A0A8B6CQM2_MYTGA|nr:Hypothetical predicted protein [Mytilus galloprovincialis]